MTRTFGALATARTAKGAAISAAKLAVALRRPSPSTTTAKRYAKTASSNGSARSSANVTSLPLSRVVELHPIDDPPKHNWAWLAPTVLALAFAQLLF